MGQYAAVEQQPLELVLAPAPAELSPMQGCERGCIARTRFGQHRFGPAEKPGKQTLHRCAIPAAFCGRASGGRR